ncbi:MAG TPA: fumarylacetoacetate hydrolase family protein [Bryobacteraceae bacterium]|jgi:2-dehydro-3-deoxy-D-arabinonate dehydratase|nr:fumarylacetoacetate hydrolase family protein [Bryobacteraceae bacterium]
MKLYRTSKGSFLEHDSKFFSYSDRAHDAIAWDALIARDDLPSHLSASIANALPVGPPDPETILPPIGNQEVWAAGVTYYRSRNARMEESKSAGGGDFYERVYDAPRPELFFKATAARVVGPGQAVAIRDDASWSVPEPELALLVTPTGKITGYTVGNDMSSRDIEGENPLYLPQAKVYDRSCALGPCILVSGSALPKTTEIRLDIARQGSISFSGTTTLESLKREPQELVDYLFRNNKFAAGCFLLTGTGIVPPDSFTLQKGDEISISITGIGTLTNPVG